MCFSDGNAVSVLTELFHISLKRLLLLNVNPMCAPRCFVILIRLGVSGQESVWTDGGGGGGGGGGDGGGGSDIFLPAWLYVPV